MGDIQKIIADLAYVAANPEKQLKKYLAEGKQAVGCFPEYTPEVLADAAGIVPFGCWGGQVEFTVSKKYLVAFISPILHACMELGATGKYEGLKAVIIPAMSDSLRCMTQDFKCGVKDIATIAFTPPQNRTMEASRDFLVAEYEGVKEQLEKIYGVTITDDAIAKSIDVYNAHNKEMRRFAKLANDHLDIITPVVRHAVFKSAWFMPKAEHLEIMKELNSTLESMPAFAFDGKKVVLTGITFEPDVLLEMLAENGVAVVDDDLGQESRQYRTDIPENGTPLERLADQWRSLEDPMAHSETFNRGNLLIGLCKENGANGVILGLMKFCDAEEYDFYGFNKQVQEAGYPVLSIDIDQEPSNYDQARTRIETFTELL